MVTLDDEHGQFWMERDRMWSDSIQEGHRFTTEEEATLAVSRARASVASSEDWFPRIKVVRFK
jgi:hypothetical protein